MLPTFGQIALSVQHALVGEILPQFRAICLDVNAAAITLTISHEGELASDAVDDIDVALTEVYADWPELGERDGPHIVVGFDRRDAPEAIPAIGYAIFALKGTRFLVPPDSA